MFERLDVAAPVAVLFVLVRDDRVQPRGHVGIGVEPGRFLAVIIPEQVDVEQAGFHDDPGMVQKHPFSGNTRDLSADPDRSRVGAGLRESLAAVRGLQFCENRVYPRSSSQ